MREFNIGSLYFLVDYLNDQMCYPDVKSVIYIGKNIPELISDTENEYWFFQDVRSYVGGSPYPHINSEGVVIQSFKNTSIRGVCDSDQLIEMLQKLRSN